MWIDSTVNPHSSSGDSLKSWTAASGAPYTSFAANWNPVASPVSGDDLLFGTLKSGNYSVVQDSALTLGNLSVNRALATEQVNFGGILTAASFRVIKGVANITVPTFSVTAAGATNADSSIVVGSGAGNSAVMTFAGVVGRYYDARVGVGGASGTLRLTGVNTSLLPQAPYVTDSVFGGAADAANATIVVDGATVQAWVISTGRIGSTKFTNNANVKSISSQSGVGQVQIGSPDVSNVSMEVSASADLRVSGEDGMVLVGSGVGSVTTTNILSGGSLTADLFITGADSTAGTASSTNTINISGAGTTVTTTEAFDTNGGYRYSNNRRGSTTININGGAKLYTSRYDSNAADRDADTGAASNTILNLSGPGSLISAQTDTSGFFVLGLGDRTTDVTTVSDFARIDAKQVAIATGAGATVTMSLTTDASIATGLLEMARPFRTGPATAATLNLSSGARVDCANLITSSALSASTTILVKDPGTTIASTGVAIFGGVSGDSLGGGSTNFTIRDGASAQFIALSAGGASAAGAGTGYTGTQITLSGYGTQLSLSGSGGLIGLPTDLASDLLLSANASTRSSLTVDSGASLRLVDNNINPNLDGAIAIAAASNTIATMTVDGPGTTVDSGKLITMAEAPTANAFTNASATLTLRNGAFVGVYENMADPASGNLQMSIRPSAGSTATLNIGGGAAVEDADTLLAIDGTLFVGGSGDASPVPGGRSTVNLNNGSLSAAAVAVYANSSVKINGGHLATDNLMLLGGRVDMNATTPVAIELGTIRTSSGGVMNVGKGGAAVYYSTANSSPSDLAAIRQLVYNGFNGGAWNGTNGITSSLLNASTANYGIGYTDIDAVAMTAFLDLSFSPAAQAVVFRYTLRGDANLNGTVSFDDLLALAQNYEMAGQRDWFQGDFTYNGHVDFDDLLWVAQNYGLTFLSNGALVSDPSAAARFASDWAMARSMVPEPTMLSIALVAGFCRRRRQN